MENNAIQRKRVVNMKNFLLGALFFCVLSVLLLQIDDSLDPGAKKLIHLTSPAEASNGNALGNESGAYLYLMGIHAAVDEQPLEVGQRLYNSIKQGEKNFIAAKSDFQFQDYPQDKHLPLPSGDLFCAAWEDGCMATIFSSSEQYDSVIHEHSVLVKRYRKFLELNDYRTLTIPILSEPLPLYQYISKANRLVMLEAIKQADTANISQSADTLLNNIAKLRGQLEKADTIIGKMIFLMLVAENIDVLSILAHRHNYRLPNTLDPISVTERSFDIPMSRELAMAFDIYRNLDRHPDFWEMGGKAPGWAVRMVFKPNMSTNATYSVYKKAIEYSRLSQTEFTRMVKTVAQESANEFSLRNYVGTVLTRISAPDYNEYIARFFDVNAKIVLFNQTVASKDLTQAIDPDKIKNPYFETEKPPYFSADQKQLCFDGPLPDNKGLRCLRRDT